MRHALNQWTALKWTLGLLLALTACHRTPAPPAANAAPGQSATAAPASSAKPASGFLSMFSAAPAEAPPPPPPGDFKIVSVTLGNAVDALQQVPASKTVFGRYDRIYAAVLSTGSHQGLVLSAKWTTDDGQLVAQSEQALVPTSATVTTFSLRNGEPWPAGKYQLLVSVDQLPQNVQTFEIR